MKSLNISFLNEPCRFDGKSFLIEPEVTLHNGPVLSAVANHLWQASKHLNYTHLIAPGAGAGPLAAAIALAAQSEGFDLHMLQMKDPKRYGERSRLYSGKVPANGSNALIVDDCLLSGRSVRTVMAQLAKRSIGVHIVGVATLYDHDQLQGSRRIAASGIPVFSVLQRTSLGLTRRANTDAPVLNDPLWTRRGYQLHRARSCAPVIFNNLAIVADDTCCVWGIDLATGTDVWCIEPLAIHSHGINNDFLVVDGHLYFSTYAGELVKANAATGEVIWRRKVDHACHSAPVFDRIRNLLYLNCESTLSGRPAGALRAFDTNNGQQLWVVHQGDYAPCEPTFDGQRIFATCNQQTLICVGTQGQQLWQAVTMGLVRGAVWADKINQSCITYSERGYLECFDAATGAQRWMRRISTASNHVAPFWSGSCIVISDTAGYLFGVDPLDGRMQWASQLRSPTAWRPTGCQGGFIATTKGGNVAQYDHAGQKLAEQKTNLKCFAPAAVGQHEGFEYAVFLTLDGRLVCYQLASLSVLTEALPLKGDTPI
jgi:outer membrane protein assembly factor BamB/orotate phosphoribosyltransferase